MAFYAFWCTLFILAALSSFTILTLAEENSKSSETTTYSTSQDDIKEKRSQEEIMFGNQQNKPNGLVDDLMNVEENYTGSQVQDSKPDETTEDVQSGYSDWDSAGYQETLPMVDLVNSLYDQKEMYQPIRRPLRKRSLRSSIGQMIQKRGIRMPRRSMRLKRQVDMEDLLSLFGNERFYNEDAQTHSFSGRARTVAKRHVPGRFSTEYRFPFQQRDDEEDDEVQDLLLLPPNSRYTYRPREEKNEGIQKWLNRHTIPSKRSPFFYPIDYRYIPRGGYKKRSNGNVGRYLEDEAEDFGKWGHVVQVPEAYASPEDIARLYGLANILSDGDEVRKSP